MGTYYKKKEQFIKDIVTQIVKANQKRLAVSIAIYTHGLNGNPQPKLNKDIGNWGRCFHLHFDRGHTK